VVLVALSGVGAGWPLAKKKPVEPLPLSQEHRHPSGAFTFRTPDGWKVGPSKQNAAAFEASGDGMLVRLLFEPRDLGYDAVHGNCMLERLVPKQIDVNPAIQYEYDYVSNAVGERRTLDSAFRVVYDKPVDGSLVWRQRNLTVVGAGQSLCIVTFAPQQVWKGDARLRATLDAVIGSITFAAR
jgi:hypothetical protein